MRSGVGMSAWLAGFLALSGAQTAAARDILDTLRASGNHAMFLVMVEQSGLAQSLRAPGPITLLAPHDLAFRELEDGGGFEILLSQPDRLRAIIAYHIIPGSVGSGGMSEGMAVPTTQGKEVVFLVEGGAIVNHARVLKADIRADNGIIHAIDEVLLPPGF